MKSNLFAAGKQRAEFVFTLVLSLSLCGLLASPQVAAQAAPAATASSPTSSSSTDQVRASHILVGTEAEANELRKEIVAAGADAGAFAKVARKKSKDVTTRPLGGDLGYFSMRSGFDKDFAAAAFSLKVGEVSKPVKTSFGYHLIMVTDRRAKPSPKGAPGKKPASSEKPPASGDLAPAKATPSKTASAVVPRVNPKRLLVARDPSFQVTVLTAKGLRSQPGQFLYRPEQAVELEISVLNEGATEHKFPTNDVMPMGLRVTPLGGSAPLTADFSKIKEPADSFAVLKPHDIRGVSVSVDDYFKLEAAKRYRIGWDMRTLLANLEKQFPKAKEQPDYDTVSAALRKPGSVTSSVLVRDVVSRFAARRRGETTVSIFESYKPQNKYYAEIFLFGQSKPIVIALDFKAQFNGARWFANNVLNGFYDGLDFFEVQEGDYVLGGDPLRTGTGAPSGTLPLLRNMAKLPHKRGTVSLLSRSVRTKGPARGGQVGSIFAICLKPHPEWDRVHVPFGEVVSGLEILEQASKSMTFRTITILTESQYKGPSASETALAAGNPQAVIKTSKGEIKVQLYEDVARNTVVNFVRLALDGFYDKGPGEKEKQKFIYLGKDAGGKRLLIQTGSPTNEFDGGPGYKIRSEHNTRKCQRGALVMAIETDPKTGQFIPDTAGSQFFICLSDIPAYDYQPGLTVFGKVSDGLDVLDKLEEGDTIEGVEITKKKGHSYTVQKMRTSGGSMPGR